MRGENKVRKVRYLLSVVVILLMCLLSDVGTYAETIIVAKGSVRNITWELDSNGHLEVYGTGDYYDYLSKNYMSTDFSTMNYIPWKDYRDQIITARIDVSGMVDASDLLSYCTNLKEVDFTSFDTSSTRKMNHMFYSCFKLERITFGTNFVTDNVENMAQMFCGCGELKELNLSFFNTKKVSTMRSMFSSCQKLKNLNVSNWDTSNVEDMLSMFGGCKSLETLNINHFNTKKVKNMHSMFCYLNVKKLDISGFDTSNVLDMSAMFAGDEYLETIEIGPGFNTSRVQYMDSMFRSCKKLEFDFSKIDTSNALNIAEIFDSCDFVELDLSSWNLKSLTTNYYTLNKGNINNSIKTPTQGMLASCYNLKYIKAPQNLTASMIELPVKKDEKWVSVSSGEMVTSISEGEAKKIVGDYDYWERFSNTDVKYTPDNDPNGMYYYITEEDYEKLLFNMSSVERYTMDALGMKYWVDGDGYSKTNLSKYKGSCYGMSSWMCMQNDGILDFGVPLRTKEIDDPTRSAINFYQAQQVLFGNASITMSNFFNTADKIMALELKNAFKSGKIPLISYMYHKESSNNKPIDYGSHTVSGIYLRDVSEGERTVKGNDVSKYKYCAVVYDPNYPNTGICENSDYNIYFDDEGNFWVPCLGIDGDNQEHDVLTTILSVTTNERIINAIDYYSAKKSDDYATSNETLMFSQQGKKARIRTNSEEYSFESKDNPRSFGVMPVTSDTIDGEVSPYVYIYYPEATSYSTEFEEPIDMGIIDQNYLTHVITDTSGEIEFLSSSSVYVENRESANNKIILVSNNISETIPWYQIEIETKGTQILEVSNKESGICIKSDDLKNVEVLLIGSTNTESVSYSSDYKNIELKNDGGKLVIYEDRDNDGICETNSADTVNPNDQDDHNNHATDDYEDIIISDGFSAYFALTDSWEDGYNALIRIENTSEENIDNWTLTFDYVGEISNVWNAEILSHDGNRYTIKNAGWNQDIAPGQTIEIGLSGQENFVAEPTDYALISGLNEGNTNDFSISIQIYDDWGSGCNGNMTITNNSDTTIEDWVLEFDFDAELTSIWNAEIVSHEGAHYIIKNAQHNSNIEPGQSVSVGFNGGEGAGSTELRGYKLYSYDL